MFAGFSSLRKRRSRPVRRGSEQSGSMVRGFGVLRRVWAAKFVWRWCVHRFVHVLARWSGSRRDGEEERRGEREKREREKREERDERLGPGQMTGSNVAKEYGEESGQAWTQAREHAPNVFDTSGVRGQVQ